MPGDAGTTEQEPVLAGTVYAGIDPDAKWSDSVQEDLAIRYLATFSIEDLATWASYAASNWARSRVLYGYQITARELKVDYEGACNQAVAWFCNSFDPARASTLNPKSMSNTLCSFMKWTLGHIFRMERTNARRTLSESVSLDAPVSSDSDTDMYGFVGDHEAVERILSRAEGSSRSYKKLYDVLKRLPVKQRKAMVLLMHGRSKSQIAYDLGVTRQAIESWLIRLRRYFTRSDVAKMGFYISDRDYEKAWMEYKIVEIAATRTQAEYLAFLRERLREMNEYDRAKAKADAEHRRRLKEDWAHYNRSRQEWHRLSRSAKLASEARKSEESEKAIHLSHNLSNASPEESFPTVEDVMAAEAVDAKSIDLDESAMENEIKDMIRKAEERRRTLQKDQEDGLDTEAVDYDSQKKDFDYVAGQQREFDYYFGDDEQPDVAVG